MFVLCLYRLSNLCPDVKGQNTLYNKYMSIKEMSQLVRFLPLMLTQVQIDQIRSSLKRLSIIYLALAVFLPFVIWFIYANYGEVGWAQVIVNTLSFLILVATCFSTSATLVFIKDAFGNLFVISQIILLLSIKVSLALFAGFNHLILFGVIAAILLATPFVLRVILNHLINKGGFPVDGDQMKMMDSLMTSSGSANPSQDIDNNN